MLLIKREHLDRTDTPEGKDSHVKMEDCSGVDTSQGIPEIVSKSPEAGRDKEGFSCGFRGWWPGQGRGERIWGNRASLFLQCTAVSSCSMCNLVPQSGIESRSLVLGVWHVQHCTTREVPGPDFLEVRVPPNFYMAPEDIKVLNPWLVAGGEMAEGICSQRRWLLWR